MSARTWILRDAGDERFDLLRNGRQLACDLTKAEAMRRVQRGWRRGDKCQIEEADGHRRNITRSA